MKKLLLITLIIIPFVVCAQNGWTNKARVMPDKLRELPVGIMMWHDPNPCYPVKVDSMYYWKHSTMVKSMKQGLTVTECGSFIWYDESGWHANMKYSPKEFSVAFNCKAAALSAGKTFTYKKNWRFGKQLYGGDALWYIIARDKNGKLYKGTALIETENRILTENN